MPVITDPKEIEAESFRIIDRYLTKLKLPAAQKKIMQRVAHATADLNFSREIIFHPDAVSSGIAALRAGENIITDASMVKAGINKKIASDFGARIICFINDKDIVREARQLKITRAILSMRKSVKMMQGAIVAIGNAPTALFELCDLVKKGEARPALIIGVPIGFVGAKESKEKLRSLNIPYITNQSRKGGSSVAAAITNALLKLAEKEGRE